MYVYPATKIESRTDFPGARVRGGARPARRAAKAGIVRSSTADDASMDRVTPSTFGDRTVGGVQPRAARQHRVPFMRSGLASPHTRRHVRQVRSGPVPARCQPGPRRLFRVPGWQVF
mgnify:CR=1 FL=1